MSYLGVETATTAQCVIDGCLNQVKVKKRGWCNAHYQRWRYHGNPLGGGSQVYTSPEGAFKARTEWRGDCLVWTGSIGSEGYGYIRVAGKTVKVHRYAYEQVHGPIPVGMHVDHRCHNRACCNEGHLRLLTPRQNQENRSPNSIRSSSGYLNVSWNDKMRKWWVRLTHRGTTYYGGFFDDVEEANLSAVALRNKYQTHNDLDKEPIDRNTI